jgi:hypothetical protein
MPGGWNVTITMDEAKFQRMADLCTRLTTSVLRRFRLLTASPHRGLIERLVDHRISQTGGRRFWIPGLASWAVVRPTCDWRSGASTSTETV